MTWPQFLSALNNIGPVREELRPKTLEEVRAKMGDEISKAQAAALALKENNRARTGR